MRSRGQVGTTCPTQAGIERCKPRPEGIPPGAHNALSHRNSQRRRRCQVSAGRYPRPPPALRTNIPAGIRIVKGQEGAVGR